MISKQNNSQKAFFSVRFLTLTTIFGFLVYCSFWTGRFYFDYYAIKDASRNIFLKAHLKDDRQILENLNAKIHNLGTPIYPEDIKLIRKPDRLTLKISYSEYLFIGDYPLYKFNFLIDETRYFKK